MVTRGARAAGTEAGRLCGVACGADGCSAGATAAVVSQWPSTAPPAATITSTMATAMSGCSPYVLRVKCTHDGNFITVSLRCPRIPAGIHCANHRIPAPASTTSMVTAVT